MSQPLIASKLKAKCCCNQQITGACCMVVTGEGLVCRVTSRSHCDFAEGLYLGDGTTCDGVDCDPQEGPVWCRYEFINCCPGDTRFFCFALAGCVALPEAPDPLVFFPANCPGDYDGRCDGDGVDPPFNGNTDCDGHFVWCFTFNDCSACPAGPFGAYFPGEFSCGIVSMSENQLEFDE